MTAMVPDTLTPIPPAGAADGDRATHVKFRLRFKKIGNLRLVSHHDLMHVVERMMRRAEIPFAVSQGFHPQPRMVFALSLALGVVGLSEVLELELNRPFDADDLLRRLNAAAPIGLEFLSIAPAPAKGARVRRAFYRLPLTEIPSDLAGRIAQFLASQTSWTVRTRPTRRRLNVRPFVSELLLTSSASPSGFVGGEGRGEGGQNPSRESTRSAGSLSPLTPDPSPRKAGGRGESRLPLSRYGSLDHSDRRCPAGGDHGRPWSRSASRSGRGPRAVASGNSR